MARSKKPADKGGDDTPNGPEEARRRARTEASLGRKIWQAGLGAYGKAIGETAHNVAKLTSETSKLFEDLAEKGAELERESHVDTGATRGGLFDRPPLEQRFQQLKSAFNLKPAEPDRIARLEAKVDALRAEIAALSPDANVAESSVTEGQKPSARKTPAKRKAAAKKSTADQRPMRKPRRGASKD